MSDRNPLVQPRTAVVDIFVGDDLDQLRHLERRAEAAKSADSLPRLGDEVPEYLAIAEQYDALAKVAEERALHVKVQALGRKVWKAVVAQHPPRKVGETNADGSPVTKEQAKSDADVGVNEDTFKDALVYGGTVELDGSPTPYQSIVEPELSADDLDQLADIDFDRLYYTAFNLNRTPAAAGPKASLVSRLTPKNDETSS